MWKKILLHPSIKRHEEILISIFNFRIIPLPSKYIMYGIKHVILCYFSKIINNRVVRWSRGTVMTSWGLFSWKILFLLDHSDFFFMYEKTFYLFIHLLLHLIVECPWNRLVSFLTYVTAARNSRSFTSLSLFISLEVNKQKEKEKKRMQIVTHITK